MPASTDTSAYERAVLASFAGKAWRLGSLLWMMGRRAILAERLAPYLASGENHDAVSCEVDFGRASLVASSADGPAPDLADLCWEINKRAQRADSFGDIYYSSSLLMANSQTPLAEPRPEWCKDSSLHEWRRLDSESERAALVASLLSPIRSTSARFKEWLYLQQILMSCQLTSRDTSIRTEPTRELTNLIDESNSPCLANIENPSGGMSRQQMADYIGCDPRTLKRYIKDGVLEVFELGKNKIIASTDVLDALRSKKLSTKKPSAS